MLCVTGSLALIDEGETDHKLIALRTTDTRASQIHSLTDLDRFAPGTTALIIDWLKNYKTSDGKPVNNFKSETPTTADEAVEIVRHVHESWRKLVKGETPNTLNYYISPHTTTTSSSSS